MSNEKEEENLLNLKNEKLKQISLLSDDDLLEIFEKYVRIKHYDPFKTPASIKELYDLNIKLDELRDLVKQRMSLQLSEEEIN
jgi:hypothetical protein